MSCEDDLKEISAQQVNNNFKVNIDMQYKKLSEIIKDNKFVRQNIESLKAKDLTFKAKGLTSSSIYNFSFVDDDVMILYGDSIDQYTFPIVRDTINPNYFENYVLRQNHNGNYEQYIIKYKKINQTAYLLNYQSITDATIFRSCMPHIIGTETTEYDCNYIDDNEGQLVGCPGVGHPDHNDCMNGSVECSYLTVFLYDDNCDGGVSDTSSDVDISDPTTSGDNDYTGGTCCSNSDGSKDLDGDDFVGYPVSSTKLKLSQNGLAFLNSLPESQQDWFDGLLDCNDSTLIDNNSNCDNDLAEDIMPFFNSVDTADTAEAQAFFDVIYNERNILGEELIEKYLEILNNDQDVNVQNIYNWFLDKQNDSEIDVATNPDLIQYESPLQQEELPSFEDLKQHFPKLGTEGNFYEMPTTQVYNLVGGSLLNSHIQNPQAYSNACSIRGSRGLLYSGIDIPVLIYDGVGQRTQKGADNNNYILDAVSFDKFMGDKFGEATHELTGAAANDPKQVANLLSGKNGIYVIINNNQMQAGYSGHVDLIIDGDCISSAYTTPTGGAKSIRIWELD